MSLVSLACDKSILNQGSSSLKEDVLGDGLALLHIIVSGITSLLLPRLPKLHSQCYSNGPATWVNWASVKKYSTVSLNIPNE